MQNQSIFYNIFIFWEAVHKAQQSNTNLAIFMLDFEKAYDRVDWDFLQGTLLRLGFHEKWVKAVEALYKLASSKLLLTSGFSLPFQISRLVRQGCPLAPYLYLLFAKAFSMYLNHSTNAICGLNIA